MAVLLAVLFNLAGRRQESAATLEFSCRPCWPAADYGTCGNVRG
jgi:hypothetical protein